MPMRWKPNQLRPPIKAKTLSKYMHSNETKRYSPGGNHHNLNNSMKWREYKTEPTILVLCLIRGGKKEILEMVSRRGATAKCFSFLGLPGSQLCLRLQKKKKKSHPSSIYQKKCNTCIQLSLTSIILKIAV